MTIKKYFLFLLIVTSFLSCKELQFVPAYDANVYKEVQNTHTASGALYDGIINSTVKSYQPYDSIYSMQAANILSIVNKERARPKSFFLVGIATNIQSTFNRLRNDHRLKGILNDAQLKLNKETMDIQFKSLENSEKTLQKSAKK